MVIVGVIVWLWARQPTVLGESGKPGVVETGTPDRETHRTSPLQNNWKNNSRMQLPASEPGKYDPTLPQWEEWNRREREDNYWEWKMPINFYGKMVDYDTGTPIEGVEVHLSLTDLSNDGTSQKIVYSNSQGIFELSGATGKKLLVRDWRKDDYIRSNVDTQFSFEYAAFFDPNYHQADPNNPVVFRMKKRGEAEALQHRKDEITVDIGRVGLIRVDSQTAVQVELTANGGLREENWSARVSVSGGGIQTSTEEFPFIAPEGGYQSSLTLDAETPKPGNWTELYQGGQFYIKTADERYGRIELKAVPGKTFMRYLLFLNPSGSRNLEYDPVKRVDF